MTLERRTFLKVAAATSACAVAGATRAHAAGVRPEDTPAVLVDTTLCVGCRSCEAACAEANGQPEPELLGEDSVFAQPRKPDTTWFTKVTRSPLLGKDGEPRYAKRQCLHCLEPGCASACPVRALEKTAAGPVVYNRDRCLGCRYCMIACPFGIPQYEYDKAVPYVRKCTFCAERQAEGKPPACADACPTGALTFGKRGPLLEEAHRRIWTSPETYVHEVYGEEEVGGTSWLYLSDVPFESYGLPASPGRDPRAGLTKSALAAVPLVMTLWPPLLTALHKFSAGREEGKEDDHV
jgi:formate dehydrogenase iron-sulfur subunit